MNWPRELCPTADDSLDEMPCKLMPERCGVLANIECLTFSAYRRQLGGFEGMCSQKDRLHGHLLALRALEEPVRLTNALVLARRHHVAYAALHLFQSAGRF